MLDKLNGIKSRYEELTKELSKNEVITNQELYKKLACEHANLEEVFLAYQEYLKNEEEISGANELLNSDDDDFKNMAKDELAKLTKEKEKMTENLKVLLLPKDENDTKNVILEIRAGTGGDEAALFGMDLLRMYTRYAERHGFKTEILTGNFTELNGVKEVVMSISGRGVYSRLKYESGVHRVQRVPETESSGRIHTSAATVAILPEAEEVDVAIGPNDLRIDVFRAGGHGGQCVNTTDSAVRITHLPTGLVVTCQDEKSQLKNKEKAMKVLVSRLYDLMKTEKDKQYSEERKTLVGSGDRSERIRTYNFPQGRVTDHRTGMTLYKLDMFLDGDLDEIIDGLILKDREQQLSSI
ncbi:MAG: peptide chain release factor 1 [Eubacteriales bacterium]